MPRNGSGVMTADVDFTVEAASPPIEISKLDQALDDIADEITNSLAADGQTNPSADLKMNGFKHTNVGAATALTHYGRVTEIIDQDYIFYVDSGAADAYVITPSPAIAAYEEGQRFVWRATHTNTTTSTLNVNGLGAIVIQTNDGSALAAGAIVNGGLYEVTYDANTTPDRWVLTSPSSKLPDGMLSSNVPLLNTNNTFTNNNNGAALQVISNNDAGASASAFLRLTNGTSSLQLIRTGTGATLSGLGLTGAPAAQGTWLGESGNFSFVLGTQNTSRFEISGAGNFDFKLGTVTTTGASAAEVGTHGVVQNSQSVDYTAVLGDRDKSLHQTGASKTFTIPANGSVAYPIGTTLVFTTDNATGVSIAITTDTLRLAGSATTGTRTLAQYGMATAVKILSTTWLISGAGLS